MIYLAYGSNLHLPQMERRCPTAKVIGAATLTGYRLLFRGNGWGGVATVEPDAESSVPVLLWEIQHADEQSLDIYEGYPRLYTKITETVTLNGKPVLVAYWFRHDLDRIRSRFTVREIKTRKVRQSDQVLLGSNIRDAREAAGLSQKALGNMLQLPQTRVSLIERGKVDEATGKKILQMLTALSENQDERKAIPDPVLTAARPARARKPSNKQAAQSCEAPHRPFCAPFTNSGAVFPVQNHRMPFSERQDQSRASCSLPAGLRNKMDSVQKAHAPRS